MPTNLQHDEREMMADTKSTKQEPVPTAGAKVAADIAALLRARNPLLWCVTRDEARTERLLLEAIASAGYKAYGWDCASGVWDVSKRGINGSRYGNSNGDPAGVFEIARDSQERSVYIMRDLHQWVKDPTVSRGLATLCRLLPERKREWAQAIIVVTPSADIPLELQGHTVVIDIPLPDRAEIAALLDASIAALPEEMKIKAAPNGAKDAAIDAAIGLSACEVQATFARSLITQRKVDPATIASEKKRVIAKERILEWLDPLPAGLDGVGGLEVMKQWLYTHRMAFTPQAKEYGLHTPKGILLVGVPGCGKSLTAKAIATAWAVPLLRLDLAALKSKWVGDSEANIRRALRVVDAVGRCVLWADEIEKALQGATSGSADGGTSSDQLGALLTWMQDRESEVFVVATANDVQALPAPLLRKGRFDEIFFVDLPTLTERAAILRTALEVNKKVPGSDTIDVEIIARSTPDFVGAEISALVQDAAFAAFADGGRPMTTDDVCEAAFNTVPLARTASESIGRLRKWAVGNARMASLPEDRQQGNATSLDL